jgi:hypothetical protein
MAIVSSPTAALTATDRLQNAAMIGTKRIGASVNRRRRADRLPDEHRSLPDNRPDGPPASTGKWQ